MEHNLNTSELKSNILKSLAVIFIIFLSIIIFIVIDTQNQHYQERNDKLNKTINKTIKHSFTRNTTYYKYLLQRVGNTTNIKKHIINKNRNALYKILKPKFDFFVQENKYFKTLHIILPDGKSLLRVHKKDHFGDDLISLRPMVKEIMNSKKLTYGYETGKYTTAFRVMIPLFQDKKFLGSLGLGINPNYFIEQISKKIEEKGFLFIKKEKLKLFSNKGNVTIQNYLLQSTIDKKSIEILKLLPKDYNFEDNVKVTDGVNSYIIHTYNIEGFNKKPYAYYLFIQDITKSLNQQNTTILYLVIALFIFIVLIFLSVRFYLNKFSKQVANFYTQTLKEIKFSETYLKAVENASPNIIISSIGRTINKGNQAFLDFTRFESILEFKKKYNCICDLFIPRDGYLQKLKDSEDWFNYMRKRPNEIHKAIMLKDGKEHIFIVNSNDLHLDESIRCMAIFVDITELENLQNRYKFAINGTQDGLWDWNLETDEVYFSLRWKEMLGFKDDEILYDLQEWDKRVHPDDKEKAYTDIKANHEKKTDIYENIHRLKHKDGHWVWILDRGQTIFDENGKAVRMIGFHTDITKSKKLEIKLKESENRFRILYEKAPDAYQSLDIDGNLLVVNDKWCTELGYEKEEVIGEKFIDFLHLEYKNRFIENFSKFKKLGAISNIEFEMVQKSGEFIIVIFNGKIVYDDNGDFLQTHCIFTNITKQKQLENKLKFNQHYLEKIFDVTPNILIATNGEEIDKANYAMLKFTGFKTLESFKDKHDCICDLFLEGEGLVQSVMGEITWLNYILSQHNQLSKVSMLFQGKRHIFVVFAKPLLLDENKRSIITFIDITELEDLKDRYEFAINGTQDGLWDWDIVTNKPYFSPHWKSMLGYRDDELANEFQTWEDMLHPDDIEQTFKDIQRCHKSEDEVYENIHRLKHKDGHWVWILARGKTIFDKNGKAVRMVGFHTDITKKKELELQLKENQKIYLDFFEHTKSANIIYTTSDNGKTFIIKSLNHLVEELENLKKDDIIGKRVDKVFEGIEKFGLLDIFKEVYKSGKPYKMPLTVYKDKNVTRWRENYVFKLLNGDIVASYEDRTKEKQLEIELYEQEEIMIAQSRHAAMGEMISMIAHQWRQPLSIIAMGANNIMADIELEILDNKTLKEGAIEIIEQTQELSKTIDDFKNFFRPIKKVEEVLPEDIFEEALKVIGKSLENNDIEVIKYFNNGKKIKTFSRELMQVFINIIKNAKEALVENNIEQRKIIISLEDISNNIIEIKICDNGGGIPKEVIYKIFNPYFTTKEEHNGTGLGLYMSKTIIEKHLNGKIRAYNEKDGACFEIQLPYEIQMGEIK